MPGPNSGWFQWQPQDATQHDVREWLVECSERAEAPVDNGGVYNAGHSCFKDMGWAGHGGFLLLPGAEKVFTATALAPTEFVFQMDFDGSVCRGIVTFQKRAKELVDVFGEKAVSDKVRVAIAANRPEEQFEVVLSLYKRSPEERKEARIPGDPDAMPYGGCWIEVNGESILKEEGFEEMPLIVPRWDLWSNSNDYAASPAMNAIADIKGINVLDMIEGVLMETQLDPRLLKKASMMGAIDLSPGGITEVGDFDEIKTWAHEGRTRESSMHQDRKANQIRRMFYVDTFEPLMGIDRQLTAYEVQERQQASVNRIAPPVSRMGQEFVSPMMRRVFMMLYRAGRFPAPPESAFIYDAAGQRFFQYPKTIQTNRMSRALSGRKLHIFTGLMNRVLPIAQAGKPEILDNYNFDEISRDLDLAEGMPGEWKVKKDDVEALRKARVVAQQQAQAQAAMMQAVASKPAEVAGLAKEAAAGGQLNG